ncbi:peptide-methionine (S)-S-oxide reductase [Laribacter hongkongensis]|uniref:peptide-methionine (S)-S-oxide reductase n=1 Tax=Laribacter hongkongensis TaxID=168471 RepID=UPI00031E44A7|nr:peptide-methionine (S)-S-oxide reductase [Laribacter hongkongensis]
MQDTATFAGGCFWCLEAAFQRLPGVLKVESGYCGGQAEWPDIPAGMPWRHGTCRGSQDHL